MIAVLDSHDPTPFLAQAVAEIKRGRNVLLVSNKSELRDRASQQIMAMLGPAMGEA